MVDKVPYIIFRILPAIVILGLTVYLAYVRLHPKVQEEKLKKFSKDTPGYKMYTKMYSTQSLISWIIISFWFVASIIFDIYKAAYPKSTFVSMAGLALLVGTLGGLTMNYLYFKQKSR